MSKKALEDLAKALNKGVDDKVAFTESGESDSNVTEFIPTGSTLLDLAISNRKNGGYPVGRITTLEGLEHSGKSLMSAIAIANTQKMGGIGIFIDTERAFDYDFFNMLGVDTNPENGQWLYIAENTTENVFKHIDTILNKLNGDPKNQKLVTIVYDSHAGSTTKAEQANKDYDDEGYNTSKSKISSASFKRIKEIIATKRAVLIVTNQLRQKLNAMAFADPYCIEPSSTKIDIRYKFNYQMDSPSDEYVYEKLTVEEFSKKFVNNYDFTNPEHWDISSEFDVQILSKYFVKTDNEETETSHIRRKEYLNSIGYTDEQLVKDCDVYSPITRFFVKNRVKKHFTDGNLIASPNHIVIDQQTGEESKVRHHRNFRPVEKVTKIADFEIPFTHNYYANGWLNHNTTPGGMSLAFYASVQVRLKAMKKIKAELFGVKQVIGIETVGVVTKTRLGPNYRNGHFNIYYDSGINDYEKWLESLKQMKLIKSSGAWYSWIIDGEEIKFQRKTIKKIFEEYPIIKDEMYNTLCNALIMEYNSDELDEADISTGNIGEDIFEAAMKDKAVKSNDDTE